jgi:hypothetical protein
MSRSHGIALAGLAVLLVSSTAVSAQMRGAQCVPAVANPEMYRNCRVVIVRGDETCRCEIAPRSIRGFQRFDDRNDLIASTPRGDLGPGVVGIGNPRGNGPGAGGPAAGNGGGRPGGGVSSGGGAGGGVAPGAGGGVAPGVGTGPTAGLGNPGNDKSVGHAGESPNGRDFGNGVRGRSDVKAKDRNAGPKSSPTGLGNPGNAKSVGRAGEKAGLGFAAPEEGGPGTKGRSDGDTTGSTSGSGKGGSASGGGSGSASAGGAGNGGGSSGAAGGNGGGNGGGNH